MKSSAILKSPCQRVRLYEVILCILSDIDLWGKQLTMDPMKFGRYAAYIRKQDLYSVNTQERARVRKALWHMKRSEYILQFQGRYMLTAKGWFRWLSYYSRRLPFQHTRQKKNGKDIYLVFFDIPETMRKFRSILRHSLYHLGFRRLQKSVFCISQKEPFLVLQKVIAHTEMGGKIQLFSGRNW